MTDSAASTAPAKATGSPKKVKSKKPKTTPTHPPIASMVNAAIKNLKERGGSSTQAIKKYIAANNKCDVEKLAPFIRRYLKSAVTKGGLVQTKGKGASGSFKLKDKAAKAAAPKKAKTPKAKKEKKEGAKPKKTPKKKAAAKKPKAAPKKKAAGEKKPKAAKKSTKPKTPKKPKAVKKTPKKAATKKVAKK